MSTDYAVALGNEAARSLASISLVLAAIGIVISMTILLAVVVLQWPQLGF
jgi:hypothetical protein